MNSQQFRILAVRPALQYIGLWSASAEELLMLTAAQESHLGEYLHQLGSGPAVGAFEMEPFTHDDIWRSFLQGKANLATKVRDLAGYRWRTAAFPPASEAAGNLYYGCAMTRVFYLRCPGALPDPHDVRGMAQYYKLHYNTPEGAATVDQAIDNYRRYVQ